MKDLFLFEFIVLLIIDLIYLYCGIFESNFGMHDYLFGMAVAHLFLGPLQFIPALNMLRKKANRDNKHFVIYFILAISAISILILNFKHAEDHEEMITIHFCIQLFAWLLAHYFVYALYTLTKDRTQINNLT